MTDSYVFCAAQFKILAESFNNLNLLADLANNISSACKESNLPIVYSNFVLMLSTLQEDNTYAEIDDSYGMQEDELSESEKAVFEELSQQFHYILKKDFTKSTADKNNQSVIKKAKIIKALSTKHQLYMSKKCYTKAKIAAKKLCELSPGNSKVKTMFSDICVLLGEGLFLFSFHFS